MPTRDDWQRRLGPLYGGAVALVHSTPWRWPTEVGDDPRAAGWLVALGGPIGVVAWIGVALWVIGVAFESVGDAQLAAYKRDPQRGPVMDRGLWRFTRHPNYFGDACVWWGLWLIAAEGGWVGAASVVGPVLLTFLLTRWSGMPTTEGRMRRKKPGYADYVARTPAFVPWFP